MEENRHYVGSWIPRRGFRILGTGTGLHCTFSRIPDSRAQNSGFHKQKFPGFRIPQAKFPGFPCIERQLVTVFIFTMKYFSVTVFLQSSKSIKIVILEFLDLRNANISEEMNFIRIIKYIIKNKNKY